GLVPCEPIEQAHMQPAVPFVIDRLIQLLRRLFVQINEYDIARLQRVPPEKGQVIARSRQRFAKGVAQTGEPGGDRDEASGDNGERTGETLGNAQPHQKLRRTRAASVLSRGSSL